MHYECELAVVIGASARKVARRDAMRHVAGYTVANDYAVRDYLENWYRPNLRAKNRDGCTVLGPWLVPADEVADPHALELRTLVNGRLVQRGNTRDLIDDIPALIEYLSSFMTLQAGDVILTGTPEGVVDVEVGDEVVTEIDGNRPARQHDRRRRPHSAAEAAHATGSSRQHAHPASDRRRVGRRSRLLRERESATQEVLAEVAAGGAAEIEAAVAAAKAAFPKWAALAPAERAKTMVRLGDLIAKHVPEIARIETQDTGQTISQTGKQLVPRAADNFYYFAEMCTRVDGHTYPTPTQPELHAVPPGRRVRADLAVERAVHDRHLEDRALPGVRQHRGAEDERAVAAERLALR